jgi:hypothetical protein
MPFSDSFRQTCGYLVRRAGIPSTHNCGAVGVRFGAADPILVLRFHHIAMPPWAVGVRLALEANVRFPPLADIQDL